MSRLPKQVQKKLVKHIHRFYGEELKMPYERIQKLVERGHFDDFDFPHFQK